MAALFLFMAFVLSSFSVNNSFAQVQADDEPVEVFVTSNGIHTDFVLPVKTRTINWRHTLPMQHFRQVDSSYTHVAFGWGDRRFYMETPSWSDLTLGVALRSALWPTPSALHVVYLKGPPRHTRQQQPLLLSPEQYRKLVTYIDSRFQQANGQYRHITGSGYSPNDTFYEAHGKFHILNNCNNWVNRGLKAADTKAALWAPLPFAVMRQLR
ncbi:TIGR02117 family protein [Pontibacter sp. CAU 1760]